MSNALPLFVPARRRRWSVVRRIAVMLVTLVTVALGVGVPMAAAAAQINVSVTVQTTLPAPSGGDIVYAVRIQCSDLNGPDCTNVRVDIPLPQQIQDASVGNVPGGGTSTFTRGTGLSIVIGAIKAGETLDLPVTMNTENGFTADGFSWTVEATVTSDSAPTVKDSAPGKVFANVDLSLAKTVDSSQTVGGQPVVLLDTTVRYRLDPCDPTQPGAPGSLGLASGSLVDQLPAGVTFVAASGNGSYDSGANTVTWSFTNLLPGACTPPAPYWVDVIYPSSTFGTTAPLVTRVTNSATVTATPIGATTPLTASDSVTHLFTSIAPPPPGSFDKTASAPLQTAGHFSVPLTHPGIWGAPGGHEAEWHLTAANPSNDPYTLSVTDRLPCSYAYLPGGTVLRSANVSPVPGEPVCTKPTFVTQQVVVSADFQSAVDAGWAPTWVSTSGATGAFVRVPGTTSFVPSNLPAGDEVAEVVLPRDDRFVRSPKTSGTVATLDGYMRDDISYPDAPGGVPVLNSAHFQEFQSGQVAVEADRTAQINVTTTTIMTSIRKSVLADGEVVLQGSNTGEGPLSGVVLTDLLPTGVSYQGTPPATIPVGAWDVSVTDNYGGTTRQLVRLSLKPGQQLQPGGRYFAQFQTTGLSTTDRQPGTTTNTAQIHLPGAPALWCGGVINPYDPTSTNDPYDLDADGLTTDRFCASSASVVGRAPGALLRSVKLVRGDLDSSFQGFPTVGSANAGGSGQFRIQVTNRGSVDLQDAVLYDVLPRLGDSGVRLAGVPRLSDFTPSLSGVPTVNAGPASTVIEYSQAALPCRGEVGAGGGGTRSAFPFGCTDDWSAAPPSDLSTVTGLRISGLGTLPRNSTDPNVDITVPVSVPTGATAGQVAWNSFAVDARRSDTQAWLLPTEPPKVGLAVPRTDVELAKTVNGGHNVSVPSGTVVHYTITAAHGTTVTVNPDGSVTYTNPAGSAPSTARAVVVTDAVPAGVSIVPGSSSTTCGKDTPGGTFDEATGVWTVGDIAPGQSFSLCFDATVTGTGRLTNQAQVSATGGPEDVDSTPGNLPTSGPHEDDEADAVVTLPSPGIDLVKQVETSYLSGTWLDANAGTSEKPVYGPNTPVRYRFLVTDTGDLPLTGVTVSDPRLGTGCPDLAQPFDLAPGQSRAVVCTMPHGFPEGDQVNTADVTGQPTAPGGGPVGSAVTDTDTAQITVVTPFEATPISQGGSESTPTGPVTGSSGDSGWLPFTGASHIAAMVTAALVLIGLGLAFVLWPGRQTAGRHQASRRGRG